MGLKPALVRRATRSKGRGRSATHTAARQTESATSGQWPRRPDEREKDSWEHSLIDTLRHRTHRLLFPAPADLGRPIPDEAGSTGFCDSDAFATASRQRRNASRVPNSAGDREMAEKTVENAVFQGFILARHAAQGCWCFSPQAYPWGETTQGVGRFAPPPGRHRPAPGANRPRPLSAG